MVWYLPQRCPQTVDREMRVYPEELMEFAEKLDRFNRYLTSESNRLKARFRDLGEMWKEQGNDRFAEAFSRLMSGISAYLNDAAEYPELQRKRAKLLLEALGHMPQSYCRKHDSTLGSISSSWQRVFWSQSWPLRSGSVCSVERLDEDRTCLGMMPVQRARLCLL